eukprot:15899519-Heterocapsa_arctica.AAC.1
MAHVLIVPCHENRPSQRQDRARHREAGPTRPRPNRAHNREAVREVVHESHVEDRNRAEDRQWAMWQ